MSLKGIIVVDVNLFVSCVGLLSSLISIDMRGRLFLLVTKIIEEISWFFKMGVFFLLGQLNFLLLFEVWVIEHIFSLFVFFFHFLFPCGRWFIKIKLLWWFLILGLLITICWIQTVLNSHFDFFSLNFRLFALWLGNLFDRRQLLLGFSLFNPILRLPIFERLTGSFCLWFVGEGWLLLLIIDFYLFPYSADSKRTELFICFIFISLTVAIVFSPFPNDPVVRLSRIGIVEVWSADFWDNKTFLVILWGWGYFRLLRYFYFRLLIYWWFLTNLWRWSRFTIDSVF